MSSKILFDVCIVGTGAGGGVMIDELTAAGMSVCALERGEELGPRQFLQHDELSNTIRGQGFAPELLETLRENEGEKAKPGRYSALAHTLGGSTVHWASVCWRFRPDDFNVLSKEGPVAGANLADWPINYKELAPFYSKAEKNYGVSGVLGSNPYGPPGETPYPNPPLPWRTASHTIKRGADKLGLTAFPSPMGINSQAYDGRAPCMNGGMCAGFGCPVHAKASPLSIHIPRARKTGRLDLRTQARVYEITVDKAGKAKSVLYIDAQGNHQEVFARQIIVAGGSLGSAQLLHLSKSSQFPRGIGNNSDQLGRNLMFHIVSYIEFEMDEVSQTTIGSPGMVAIDDYHASDKSRGFIRGGVILEATAATPIGFALKAGAASGKQTGVWGSLLKDHIRRHQYTTGLVSVGEDLAQATNRVDLDPEIKDHFGIPVHRITHKFHKNDLKQVDFFEEKLLEIADATGTAKSWVNNFVSAKSGTGHLMGSCRMGHDPETSVLNRWCQTHDVDNLWVVDGSFFPSSGGYNPTLTIVANAYRVADYFIAQMKKNGTLRGVKA